MIFEEQNEQNEQKVQKNNFKCGKCNHKFYINIIRNNMLRCPDCGYRIIYKLRTRNYITYKTK